MKIDPWLLEFKDIAWKYKQEGKLAMISRSENHAAYKLIGDNKIHVRYICPKCGHREELFKEIPMPYKVKCSKCGKIVWQSKIKKSRKKKKEVIPI